MKNLFSTFVGVIGSSIASLLGGWDMALQTLIIFMTIDYITGLMVAGIFKNSTKPQHGALASVAGWKGLCREGVALLIVLIACSLDLLTGANLIRDAVVIAYCTNEAISIIENAGLMGVPIPTRLTKAIEALKSKEDDNNENC